MNWHCLPLNERRVLVEDPNLSFASRQRWTTDTSILYFRAILLFSDPSADLMSRSLNAEVYELRRSAMLTTFLKNILMNICNRLIV